MAILKMVPISAWRHCTSTGRNKAPPFDDNTEESDASGSIGSDTKGIIKHASQATSVQQPYTSTKDSLKRVHWSTVKIYSHSVLLGDNPSVSSGPPLTISWEPFDSKVLLIDDYDSHKQLNRTKREMLLPRSVREDWLRDQGYSRGQLKEAIADILQTQESRSKSAKDGQ